MLNQLAENPESKGPLRLQPFCFWLSTAAGDSAARQVPDPAGLTAAIRLHLEREGCPHAEPLRWAITAVDPGRGLRLEGMAVTQVSCPERTTSTQPPREGPERGPNR